MSTCMKALCRHVKQNKSQGVGGGARGGREGARGGERGARGREGGPNEWLWGVQTRRRPFH